MPLINDQTDWSNTGQILMDEVETPQWKLNQIRSTWACFDIVTLVENGVN